MKYFYLNPGESDQPLAVFPEQKAKAAYHADKAGIRQSEPESMRDTTDHFPCSKTSEQEALLRAGITLIFPEKGCR